MQIWLTFDFGTLNYYHFPLKNELRVENKAFCANPGPFVWKGHKDSHLASSVQLPTRGAVSRLMLTCRKAVLGELMTEHPSLWLTTLLSEMSFTHMLYWGPWPPPFSLGSLCLLIFRRLACPRKHLHRFASEFRRDRRMVLQLQTSGCLKVALFSC